VGKGPAPPGPGTPAPGAATAAPEPPPGPEALRRTYQALVAELAAERQASGILPGDWVALDGLSRAAEAELSRGRWPEAIACLQSALARLHDFAPDQELCTGKLRRLHAAVRRHKDATVQSRVKPLVNAAVRAIATRDYAAANAALNRGFAELDTPAGKDGG
jgi:hypothetical protein